MTVLVDRVRAGIEGEGPDGAAGRTARQALEIDGAVQLPGLTGVHAGEFVRARITDAAEDDLTGAMVGRAS